MRQIGSAVFVGVLALAALLERLQFQLRAAEASVWWASNGRDVVNGFALGMMALGLGVLGFTGPMAVGLAATIVILLSAVQGALDRHRLSTALSLLAALVLGAPVLAAPRATNALFLRALTLLFP